MFSPPGSRPGSRRPIEVSSWGPQCPSANAGARVKREGSSENNEKDQKKKKSFSGQALPNDYSLGRDRGLT